MAATIIDSTLFGDVFSTAAMRSVWSDENRVAQYLAFEAALAKVQGVFGVIPAEAAAEIERVCHIDSIDMTLLKAQTERAGTPIVGLVAQINDLCRDGLGQYSHWGATTQDVTDTATVLQIAAALALVDADLQAIGDGLAVLARTHRDTPMAGRTKLQQAVPVTFGFKMAGLLAAVQRHRERLVQLRPRVLQLEFAGAAGTLASLQDAAMQIQEALAAELGLARPLIAWHTQRDTIAEVGAWLGLVGGTLGKLAMDVKLLMQTEVGEVFEPTAPGRGSSSTMPHKRNPVACNVIHAAISVVRQHAASLLEAMVGDHERSTGPWEIEWIVLPEAFCLLAGALAQSRALVEGLEVDADRMRANLDMTHGLVVAEAVMMGLAPAMGREHAHQRVSDLCRAAIEQRRPLLDLLAGDAEIAAHATRDRLSAMCDPAGYLGQSGVMVDRVLARWN